MTETTNPEAYVLVWTVVLFALYGVLAVIWTLV